MREASRPGPRERAELPVHRHGRAWCCGRGSHRRAGSPPTAFPSGCPSRRMTVRPKCRSSDRGRSAHTRAAGRRTGPNPTCEGSTTRQRCRCRKENPRTLPGPRRSTLRAGRVYDQPALLRCRSRDGRGDTRQPARETPRLAPACLRPNGDTDMHRPSYLRPWPSRAAVASDEGSGSRRSRDELRPLASRRLRRR